MTELTKQKFISGVIWLFIQNFLVKGITFFVSIILARILSPEDFGLVGMLSIFIVISQVFIESGFGEALIQKETCTDSDYSTAFSLNVAISVTVYAVLYFISPIIADFYNEPKLIFLTRVLGLNIVIGSFNIVQRSKLQKQLDFKQLAILNFGASIVGGFVGLFLALLNYGVWALVAQNIAATLTCLFFYPFFTKWHPRIQFSKDSFRYLWNYGSKMLVTGVFSAIQTNIANILIGKYYKAEQLGYYSKAQSLGEMPSYVLFSVFSNVTFPTFCNLQNDRDKLLLAYKKILFNTVLIVCPIIVLLSILSRPIVVLLLTEKWNQSIPLLQILLISRMFLPIGATHTNLIRSVGNTKLYMKLYFITGPVSLLAIIIALPYGVKSVALSMLIASVFSYIIPAIVTGKLFGYSFLSQIYDWRKIILSILLMTVVVTLYISFVHNLWLQLIGGVLIGLFIYLLSCFYLKLIDKNLIRIIRCKLL